MLRFCFFRLDLAETYAKTQKHQIFHTKFVWKSSFPINVKFGGDDAEDKRRKTMHVSLPNSPPITRYYRSSIPYISQVITTKKRKNGISAMPRSILRISIWNFNVVFGPNVHTNGKPGLYIYIFHSSYGRFCIFRIFISAISLGQKKKEKKAWLLVCWFVHNQHRVKKSHPNTLYWAGHGQSTSLAATWLAHLVPKL